MSDAFQDRENAFEKQFAHDEELRFKAIARRNKAVALWAAGTKGLSGAEAEKYANEFVGAQIGKSDGDVEVALKADLEAWRRRSLRSPSAQEDGRGNGGGDRVGQGREVGGGQPRAGRANGAKAAATVS